jgi:hypothetical protein
LWYNSKERNQWLWTKKVQQGLVAQSATTMTKWHAYLHCGDKDCDALLACVMESASSSMSSLYGGHGYPATGKPTAVDAKALILSLTTEIPRSSLALSSITRAFISSGLQIAAPA